MAVSVEFGRESTATPDKNDTYLFYREVGNQQLIAIGSRQELNLERGDSEQRTRGRHKGVNVGQKDVLYCRSIV